MTTNNSKMRFALWLICILFISIFHSDIAHAKMSNPEFDMYLEQGNPRSSSNGWLEIYGLFVFIVAFIASLMKGDGTFLGISFIYAGPLMLLDSLRLYWLGWIWALLPIIFFAYFYFKNDN
jgi:hypothetical protein